MKALADMRSSAKFKFLMAADSNFSVFKESPDFPSMTDMKLLIHTRSGIFIGEFYDTTQSTDEFTTVIDRMLTQAHKSLDKGVLVGEVTDRLNAEYFPLKNVTYFDGQRTFSIVCTILFTADIVAISLTPSHELDFSSLKNRF